MLDEYADMHPRLYPEVIRPALADRQGWAVFIGTPKGHNEFFHRYEQSRKDPAWFSLVLKASETGLVAPEELRQARLDLTADQYAQEFECSFEAAIQGAYFASEMSRAKNEGRIGKVTADPLLPLRAFIDIGGAGAKADAFAMWIMQWVGQEIRVLDYYEAVGQVLGEHIAWLRSKSYDKAIIHLPHDGVNVNNLTGKTYADHMREAGLTVEPPLPNQGPGAATQRIEAARRLLPKCWFNADTTEAGREALIYYHEKRDEKRDVGLGPDHDWSSHCADAFGLMAVSYREPSSTAKFNRKLEMPRVGYA